VTGQVLHGRAEIADVGRAMVALYVLVRTDDGWRVAARQNTLAQ